MPALGSGSGNSSNSNKKNNTTTKKKTTKGKTTKNKSTAKDEQKIDWIVRAIEKIERSIENLAKSAEATYKKWYNRNKAISSEITKTTQQISKQEDAAARYLKEANKVDLSSSYKKKVRNGTINIEAVKSEKTRNKIEEYQKWYDLYTEAQDKVADLESQRADLAVQKFENIVSQYEAELESIEHSVDMIESQIDLVEQKGYLVDKSLYEDLISKEKRNAYVLREEYDTLNKALKDAMADGRIEEFSEDWYSMMSQIRDVESAILDSDKALVDFNNSLRELEWDKFDRLQETIGELQPESDFLIGLMDNDDMFDKYTGKITNEGLATQGLHAVNYNVYMKQAEQYAEEIKKLNEEIVKDPNNTLLLDRRKEMIESHRDMIESAESEKEAIIDLTQQGYDTMLDVMSKAIDKRKEALNEISDLRSYEKDIKEQTKNISSLEKQLAAYRGNDSEAGKAAVQSLKVQLEEARENLEETEYDRYISDQEKMLDTFYDETEQWISEQMEKTDMLIQNAIDATNQNGESIKETLESETDKVGSFLSDEMTKIWSSGGAFDSIVAMYDENFGTKLTTINDTLIGISNSVNNLTRGEEDKVETEPDKDSSSEPPTQYRQEQIVNGILNKPQTVTPDKDTDKNDKEKPKTNKKWGSWFVKKKYKGKKSKLNKNQSIVDRLSYFDFNNSFSNRKKYFKAMGGKGTYKGTSSQNSWMIKQMKKHGYSEGGTIGKLIKRTGEDGFVLAKSGESIITPETVSQLTKAFEMASPIVDTLSSYNKAKVQNLANSVNISIGDIQMHGVNDPEQFAEQLKHELQNNKNVIKVMQANTLGMMNGKNSHSRHIY